MNAAVDRNTDLACRLLLDHYRNTGAFLKSTLPWKQPSKAGRKLRTRVSAKVPAFSLKHPGEPVPGTNLAPNPEAYRHGCHDQVMA